MERSDAQLMQDYQNGETAAFAVLIKRHLLNIANFAYRLCGNRSDAEEIAQEKPAFG